MKEPTHPINLNYLINNLTRQLGIVTIRAQLVMEAIISPTTRTVHNILILMITDINLILRNSKTCINTVLKIIRTRPTIKTHPATFRTISSQSLSIEVNTRISMSSINPTLTFNRLIISRSNSTRERIIKRTINLRCRSQSL